MQRPTFGRRHISVLEVAPQMPVEKLVPCAQAYPAVAASILDLCKIRREFPCELGIGGAGRPRCEERRQCKHFVHVNSG